MIKVTDQMVQAYGRAWAQTPQGEPGDRTRAGLQAALAEVEKELEATLEELKTQGDDRPVHPTWVDRFIRERVLGGGER